MLMSINGRDVTDLSFDEMMDLYKAVSGGPHELCFRDYQSVVDAWAVSPPGNIIPYHQNHRVVVKRRR